MKVLLIGGGIVFALLALDWFLAWRHNDTDVGRGPETWQGWDDGHGGGGAF